MNSIQIKADHQRAIQQDAERLGLNPSDVLDVILLDFFRGWKPEDRPKFYNQFRNGGTVTVTMAAEVASRLKTYLTEEAKFLAGLNSVRTQREAELIKQTIEQL